MKDSSITVSAPYGFDDGTIIMVGGRRAVLIWSHGAVLTIRPLGLIERALWWMMRAALRVLGEPR